MIDLDEIEREIERTGLHIGGPYLLALLTELRLARRVVEAAEGLFVICDNAKVNGFPLKGVTPETEERFNAALAAWREGTK